MQNSDTARDDVIKAAIHKKGMLEPVDRKSFNQLRSVSRASDKVGALADRYSDNWRFAADMIGDKIYSYNKNLRIPILNALMNSGNVPVSRAAKHLLKVSQESSTLINQLLISVNK